MRRDFNDFEIAVGAFVAFLVFILPKFLGGLL
jgi:hypothetical protein